MRAIHAFLLLGVMGASAVNGDRYDILPSPKPGMKSQALGLFPNTWLQDSVNQC